MARPRPAPPRWFKDFTTGADGRFVIRGIPAAPLRLQVASTGMVQVRDRDVACFAGTNEKPWLELAGPTRDLQIVLREAYSLTAKVLDEHGKPVQFVDLTCDMARSSGHETQRSGNYGEVLFRYLRPGTYRLWVGDDHSRASDVVQVELGAGANPEHRCEVVLRTKARR